MDDTIGGRRRLAWPAQPPELLVLATFATQCQQGQLNAQLPPSAPTRRQ